MADEVKKPEYTYEMMLFEVKNYIELHKRYGKADDPYGIRSMCCRPNYNPYRENLMNEILDFISYLEKYIGKEETEEIKEEIEAKVNSEPNDNYKPEKLILKEKASSENGTFYYLEDSDGNKYGACFVDDLSARRFFALEHLLKDHPFLKGIEVEYKNAYSSEE